MKSQEQTIMFYEQALIEISKGRGAYKEDPLDHAKSTIDHMTTVALKALKYVEEDNLDEWSPDDE